MWVQNKGFLCVNFISCNFTIFVDYLAFSFKTIHPQKNVCLAPKQDYVSFVCFYFLLRTSATFFPRGLVTKTSCYVALKVRERALRMKTELKIWCNGSGDLQPLLDWGAESTLSPAFISNCRLQNCLWPSLWSIFPKTLHWHSPDLLVFTPGHSLLGESQEQSASV